MKKQYIVTAVVVAILAGLVYLQIRTWRKFDWERFFATTEHTNKGYLIGGVALVYADYFLRALRWKIMLKPVCEARLRAWSHRR